MTEDRSCRQSLSTVLMSGSLVRAVTGRRLTQVVPPASAHLEDVRECKEFIHATEHVSASCNIRDWPRDYFSY